MNKDKRIEELEAELELAKDSIRDVCDVEIRELQSKLAKAVDIISEYNRVSALWRGLGALDEVRLGALNFLSEIKGKK